MEAGNIIEIEHLKKHYREVKAVDDISFSVRQGELFAFLGLNGAGKSTTINILCGRLRKDGGRVRVCGLDLDTDMERIKPRLGVVFQSSVLDQTLSAMSNLKTRAALYGLDRKKFDENLAFLAEKLEFKDILGRPLNKMSGGQRRRIDIARALIHGPEILILDEPTTGLDPRTRVLVWELLAELRKTRELTIILTTHYMEEANEADSIVIIDGGRIAASDTPIALKNKYASDFLRLYDYDGALPGLLTDRGVAFTQKDSALEIEVENIGCAKELIVEYESFIRDFEVQKGRMDSVFLNITGKDPSEAAYVK